MTQMTGPHERRLWDLFEAKLEEVSRQVSYFEDPVESEAHSRFDRAWVDYLAGLGISRVDWDWGRNARQEDFYMKDPLYTSGKWLHITREVADKILSIGLP